MKVLCAISGIEFNVDHMPGYLTQREAYHPIFTVPQKQLLSYLKKWSAHELSDIDSYLLYLSLFNSTGLVHWRYPARRTDKTKSIVAGNMESLARTIGRINIISHPSFVLHKIAVSHDNADLVTSHFWIDNWNQSYVSFCEGYQDEIKHDKIVRRERSLDMLIRNPEMPVEKYARILAEWAADVGDFPTHNVLLNGKPITLSDYWKSIIIRCCKGESVLTIPELHLLKLQEYCEENINLHGNSYGYTLMAILKAGLQKLSDPFGLTDIDFNVKHPGFVILKSPEDNSTEEANIAAMIAAAPANKPVLTEIGTVYPSKIAYLRALARWEAADREKKKQAEIVAKMEEVPIDELEPIEGESEDAMDRLVDDELPIDRDSDDDTDESEEL